MSKWKNVVKTGEICIIQKSARHIKEFMFILNMINFHWRVISPGETLSGSDCGKIGLIL